MVDDVLLNKCDTIERCLKRVELVYGERKDALETDFDVQDVLVLNLQRACQAAIDLAMHLVRRGALGLPQHSAEAFALLEGAGVVDRTLAARLKAMVGFRNVAVHQYQALDLAIVRSIIERGAADFRAFVAVALAWRPPAGGG
ncbi:MAG: DUF86 domain-containing protein [Proteobacteria bacterium]|jgi:uncharacterized protein YutE (UPF0331/DUF86 family)|nr:DUF86 domain-containing protein [Pseudomonadota bacterium]